MRAKYVGNKADRIIHVVRSGEATAPIPKGTPLILSVSDIAAPDSDGLTVVLPSTAGASKSFSLRYGVSLNTMAAGEFGETVVFGVVPYALISRQTRSATSASWATMASSVSGVPLGIDVANNVFLAGASIDGSVASNAIQAVLLDSLASSAGSASATSDTRTNLTQGVRIFVRML